MRRKSDEVDYKPQVGLLLNTGKIIPYYLDISKDKYLETITEETEKNLNISEIIEQLEKLGKTALDFSEAVEQFFRVHSEVSEQTKQYLLKATEKKS